MKLIALMIMMMMMMMMIFAAPSHPTDVPSSHGDQGTLVLNEGENSTRKDTNNITSSDFHRLVFARCFLPTCGTANLGSALQVGDEKAGSATNDPYGNGKK